MLGSTKYVALDVHQATTVAAVRATNGPVIARAVLPTEDSALLEFVGGCGARCTWRSRRGRRRSGWRSCCGRG